MFAGLAPVDDPGHSPVALILMFRVEIAVRPAEGQLAAGKTTAQRVAGV